ncbi:putative fungistatic metabolite [Diplogelasinospora grovesii]|uniref:Fungistatic metabolite n=1 Tax=Diplogelasinospora grovesii TaxID=303347 RepID=A0AAN6NG62_9PEZI|nr:putative fungistatic metabolite [Diplogelasinospora grovesii]
MRPTFPVFAGLLSLAAQVGRADPTWPAATDEIEEIIYQLKGFRARLFGDVIIPCSNEASGPGRQNAAEWLRVGFHDMSTANKYFGAGGLDASLQFELTNGENTGPGHNTTLKFYSNYYSSRSSMADLIAAGVYASVRSCGGPIVPLRLGRVDATAAGSNGVPQPQNSIVTFQQQFDRMGFSPVEMIQVTACGHTLGGVHTTEFPDLVPAGSTSNGEAPLDTSVAVFDNKVVTEYIAGNTQNPLVIGPSIAVGRNSDFKVFNSDKNVTMNAMTSAASFASVCQTVLQKMIEVVPAGVTLTADPIAPYMVKPVDMQLTLNSGGSTLLLTGFIRVRTTNLPTSNIKSVTLTWKDRSGGNKRGSSGTCSTTATLQGVTTGFDDSFGFFPISATIDASTGISAYTVTINLNDGTTQSYDNNGNLYPISDAIIFQKPQSCLLQGSGALTVAAVVRNDYIAQPINLGVSYLTPRNTPDGNPVPKLNSYSATMTQGNCVGQYTFFTASYAVTGGMSYNARISVTAGNGTGAPSDSFNIASDLSGTCAAFSGSAACTSVNVTTSSSASASSTAAASSTSSSASATPTLAIKPKVGGYNRVSCWTEGTGVRALTGAAFAYDSMTLESCMANCTGFAYWGTEYGRECYCGNSLAASSSQAANADCNMVCGGNQYEYCGAGNRLELYATSTLSASASATSTSSVVSSTATGSSTVVSSTGVSVSSSAQPSQTLGIKQTVGSYTFVGCQTEGTGIRALSAATYADDAMTLESCAAYCKGYTYWGTEYGRECYCGNSIDSTSTTAPLADCNMVCAGNKYQYCGAGNRLELYELTPTVSSSSSSSVTPSSSKASSSVSSSSTLSTSTKPTSSGSSTSSATPTLAHKPTVSPYTFVSCWTEGASNRALSAKSYSSDTAMTLESCASFCSGYKYFGTEYASQCFCGDTLDSTSTNASLSDCSMTCTGNQYEYCGAGDRLELYVNPNVVVPTGPTQPASVTANDDDKVWTFVNCYTEGTAVRALGSSSFAADTMTLESCATFCGSGGYQYAGAEYGRECYCGNSFGSGAVVATASDCSMTCAGNGSEYCGAGNRLSVYSSSSSSSTA